MPDYEWPEYEYEAENDFFGEDYGSSPMGNDFEEDNGFDDLTTSTSSPINNALAASAGGGSGGIGSFISQLLGGAGSGIASLIPALLATGAGGLLGSQAFDDAFAKLRKTLGPSPQEQELLDIVSTRARGRDMTPVERMVSEMQTGSSDREAQFAMKTWPNYFPDEASYNNAPANLNFLKEEAKRAIGSGAGGAGSSLLGMKELDEFSGMARKMANTPQDYGSILGEINPLLQPFMQEAASKENYGRRQIGAEMSKAGNFFTTAHTDLQGRLQADTDRAISQAIAQMAQNERGVRSGEAQRGLSAFSTVPGMRADLAAKNLDIDPARRLRSESLDAAVRGASLLGASRGNIASATAGGINSAGNLASSASSMPANVLLLQQLLSGK